MSGEVAPWLVVVDMQRIFGQPGSDWFTPDFASASTGAARLREAFGSRVALTRFVAPETPAGAWVPYYEDWPFALVPDSDPLYELMPDFPVRDATVIIRSTFGKWDAETAAALGDTTEIVLCGVSTDCCVLSTALAAADSGVRVRIAADACAGATETDHRRALEVMALYAPLIEITTVAEVLSGTPIPAHQ
ncbi:nicotinamidase-related amidase [Frondihabitans sp. PhB188]|uniref:cysteine hydrolase family protein n=1 Tax=Frondihabitans sp. PhB188 TaxID=2485200 RepID=UPI000FAC694D|nr:isochorismatase family cysteine hydrolase [Frondihabitans sp. PhB188]ROQ38324.1 nicotinamidase-related amidase [Frondihabitans sp. PhB188]